MNRRRRRVLISLAAAGVASRLPSARARTRPVETVSGAVAGTRSPGAWAFKGIPYGGSTGGPWRFLPPRDLEPWSGVLDATRYGPAAPQARSAGGEPQGESCLVLNVYTPATDDRRRPVIVWLHGGGYATGSGGARYDGSRLAADHDVVFVAINHRLSALGFLDLSELDERYAKSANVGILDIVAALRWVRRNIGAFGGDAGNVTIVGQSGGGAKVSVLLAMPAAAGLFQRAIPMSGAVLTALTRDQSRALTHALLAKLGIGGRSLRRLQVLPADALIEAMDAIGSTGTPDSTRLNFGPVVDGEVLPRQPFDPDAPAISAAVPILVGSTHDETRLFYASEPGFFDITDAALHARLETTMKTDARTVDRVIEAYHTLLPSASPAQLFLEITTQYMFTRNSVLAAERKARQGRAAAWLYRFDWISPGPIGARLRAAHAVDVPLALDLSGKTPLLDDGPARERMTARLSGAWTRFARTGDPNGGDLPRWPDYNAMRRPTMLLDAEPRVADGPERRLRAAWDVLPPFHP